MAGRLGVRTHEMTGSDCAFPARLKGEVLAFTSNGVLKKSRFFNPSGYGCRLVARGHGAALELQVGKMLSLWSFSFGKSSGSKRHIRGAS